jgi:hypothetical protein
VVRIDESQGRQVKQSRNEPLLLNICVCEGVQDDVGGYPFTRHMRAAVPQHLAGTVKGSTSKRLRRGVD